MALPRSGPRRPTGTRSSRPSLPRAAAAAKHFPGLPRPRLPLDLRPVPVDCTQDHPTESGMSPMRPTLVLLVLAAGAPASAQIIRETIGDPYAPLKRPQT